MEKIILILAILGGIFFRVWQIEKIPAGLAMDEAAYGYNAWSIATNLKDEYGKSLPLSFRSFADFKLPAYGYLTAIVVRFFGPGIWQTRTVSVIAGLLNPVWLYLIVKGLGRDKKLAFLAAFVMLWSPWAVIFSRGAFEANLGLTFMLLGAYGLVRARTESRYLLLTATAFALANYSYLTFKFVDGLLFLVWTWGYRKNHKFSWNLKLAWGLFLLLSLPSYLMTLGISGNNRIGSLLKLSPSQTGYPVIAQISANYLTYFSPRNLFFRPDPVRQRHFTEVSTFYPWLVIFWLSGGYWLLKQRGSELAKWTGALLLVGPIPAAFAADPFATLRAIAMLPAYAVLLAVGLNNWRWRGLLLMSVLMSLQLYASLMVMKYGQAAEWNGGFDKLAGELKKFTQRQVFLDIERDTYPNLALALKFPPEEMQAANNKFDLTNYYTDPSFPETINFGQYHVGKTDRSAAQEKPGAILVVRPDGVFANEPESRGWKEAFAVTDERKETLFLAYFLN